MRRRDDGMVTAETAVALPVVVIFVGALIGLIAAVSAQLRCVDAAREGARAAARGDPQATVVALARGAAPAGASVSVSMSGDVVTVTVTASTHPFGPLSGSLHVTASATSELEPDDSDDVGGGPNDSS